jgi:hypothetical protein
MIVINGRIQIAFVNEMVDLLPKVSRSLPNNLFGSKSTYTLDQIAHKPTRSSVSSLLEELHNLRLDSGKSAIVSYIS